MTNLFAAEISKIVHDAEGAEKTVVGWLVNEYMKVYNAEPTIAKIVDSTIDYVEPALVLTLQAIPGTSAIAPEVASIISEAQQDMKTVSALVYDFGPSPTAANIATAVQSNLQSLIADAHVKDPATIAKLTLIIKAVGVLATAIANAAASAAQKLVVGNTVGGAAPQTA